MNNKKKNIFRIRPLSIIAGLFINILLFSIPIISKAALTPEEAKEFFESCPVEMAVEPNPAKITSTTTEAKFKVVIKRTAREIAACASYSDSIRVVISRIGASTAEAKDKVVLFQTAVGQKDEFVMTIPIMGTLVDGNELDYQAQFTLTRSNFRYGTHTFGAIGAEPTRPQICVVTCGGTKPRPTGIGLPLPPGPGYDLNRNTGFTNVPSYDEVKDTFKNGLTVKSVPELIGQIIRILLVLIASIAVVVIIISGFRMVLYGSNPGELTKAKNAIVWAIIGLVVALMSFSLVAVIQRIIQQ